MHSHLSISFSNIESIGQVNFVQTFLKKVFLVCQYFKTKVKGFETLLANVNETEQGHINSNLFGRFLA